MSEHPSAHRSDRHRPTNALTAALALAGAAVLLLLTGIATPARADTPAPAAPAPAVNAVACQPGLGVGLVGVAAGADPRSQTYLVAHVHPGATLTQRFQVCNGTTTAITVALYPAVATIGAGAFTVPAGRTHSELTSWIHLDQPSATLAAGQRLIVTATIAVPARAVAGERYAALLAELPPAISSAGMNVVDRTGLRIYLDVGPGGDPTSDFTIDSLQATRDNHGIAHVLAQVRNTGERALDLHGALTLSDGPGSQSAGPFPARLGTTIAPHTSEPITITLNTAIRGGPWTAQLTLASGALSRQAQSALSFPDTSNNHVGAVPAHPVNPPRHRTWPVALALLLLLLLVASLIWLSRQRRSERPQHDAQRPTVLRH